MNLVFSQESIFHLYRLGTVVNNMTGKKYKLSNSDDMNALIQYCDHSPNFKIKKQFDTFLTTIEPDLINTMESEHLISTDHAQAALQH